MLCYTKCMLDRKIYMFPSFLWLVLGSSLCTTEASDAKNIPAHGSGQFLIKKNPSNSICYVILSLAAMLQWLT